MYHHQKAGESDECRVGGAVMVVGVSNVQMLHEKVYDEVLGRLKKAYKQVKIGDPLEGEGR